MPKNTNSSQKKLIFTMLNLEPADVAGKADDSSEFLKFCTESRNSFVNSFWDLNPGTNERVIAENFLICFDQLKARYEDLSLTNKRK